MAPNDYDEMWNTFLETYQAVKVQRDSILELLEELFAALKDEDATMIENHYREKLKEILSGKS